MAIDFSNSSYSPEDFDFQNCDTGGMPEIGTYHVKLSAVESQDDGEHTPSENLTFQVLGGTVPGQAGKQITERLYLSGRDEDKTKKAIQRAMGFGKRMGVYTEADAKALKAIEFEKAIGKTFIIEVVDGSYTDKVTGDKKEMVRLGYMGVWRDDSPDAPECPRVGKPALKKPAPATNGKAEPAKPAAKTSSAGKPAPKPAPAAADVDDV